MQKVTISYFGHACFLLEAEGYRIVIDPYEDGMVANVPHLELNANAVYCSHDHGDHNYVDAVTCTATDQNPPFTVMSYTTPHDDQGGALRGMNQVRIFDFSGLKVAHLGDLGDFPEPEVLEAMKTVDCLLIPVGGYYTIDPEMAAKVIRAVDPRVCIPMHYSTVENSNSVIAHVKEFIKLFPNTQEWGSTFVLTEETPKQILKMNYNV